eukprot:scaffold25736_cov47-Phaeocystis_antarctica.AAC.2
MITGGRARSLTHPFRPDRGTAERSCTPSRVPRASQAPMHHIPHPLCPGGSTPGPGARAITSAPPSPPRLALTCCPHVLGRGWRLPGSQETI